MKQLVFITGKSDYYHQLAVGLTDAMSCNVVERESFDDLVGLLGIITDIDVIISPCKLDNDSGLGAKIANHLNVSALDIPLLLLGKGEKQDNATSLEQEPIQNATLINKV
ncbi:MAG: hypothetical protein ACOCUT_02050, partial [bacterium]